MSNIEVTKKQPACSSEIIKTLNLVFQGASKLLAFAGGGLPPAGHLHGGLAPFALLRVAFLSSHLICPVMISEPSRAQEEGPGKRGGQRSELPYTLNSQERTQTFLGAGMRVSTLLSGHVCELFRHVRCPLWLCPSSLWCPREREHVAVWAHHGCILQP